jgi:hypothetical protein
MLGRFLACCSAGFALKGLRLGTELQSRTLRADASLEDARFTGRRLSTTAPQLRFLSYMGLRSRAPEVAGSTPQTDAFFNDPPCCQTQAREDGRKRANEWQTKMDSIPIAPPSLRKPIRDDLLEKRHNEKCHDLHRRFVASSIPRSRRAKS